MTGCETLKLDQFNLINYFYKTAYDEESISMIFMMCTYFVIYILLKYNLICVFPVVFLDFTYLFLFLLAMYILYEYTHTHTPNTKDIFNILKNFKW